MKNNYTMHYKTPPKEWMEGLPIGNGKLAAMVWGDDCDIISLNHERLWRGITRNRENYPVLPGALEQVRALIEQEDFWRATALANLWFGGTGGYSTIPDRIDGYQPAGDICFKADGDVNYTGRRLDIINGYAEVKRSNPKDSTIITTAYADVNKDVIVCSWSSDKHFSGKIYYTRCEDNDAVCNLSCTDSEIHFSCSFNGGICYSTAVHIKTDGSTAVDGNGIHITNATYIYAVADINVFVDNAMGDFPKIDYNYEKEFPLHKAKFSSEMNKFCLEVDVNDNELPTDKRVENVRNGVRDDGLVMLFYNFNRYLFISSCIKGEFPANLQGKWNDSINAPWGSDYHLNINLQMNYWMAEPLGLGDCADKLLNLIDSFIPHGKQAAKELYGTRGVWLPHATDIWGRSTPEGFGFSAWVGAAPWLAQHYYNRYIYSGDKEFLSERAYPYLKEVAEFFEDYLVEDKDGIYQVLPSQSPENGFAGSGLFHLSICKSAAMDVQLIYDALGYAIQSAKILGVDSEKAQLWRHIRSHLPEFKIGSDGRLLEWDKEREEKEPGHRHLSHLYGLYPSDLFSKEVRPAQYSAAEKSLEFRLAQGGGYTGWSRAWVACLYARLGNGEKLYENISKMITEFATVSLLDLHPPRIFQIDGNFGAVAALTEGVAQFRNGKLYLLHALPNGWQNGEMHGYRTPGGHTVDIRWRNGKIDNISVTIGFENKLTVVADGNETEFVGNTGEIITK